MYTLCGHTLEQVTTIPYLGVVISNNLEWAPHIDRICDKANRTLGFLRRNLKRCPQELKSLAYNTLVRSTLEYSSPIWDPHLKKDVAQLEKIQRRAARFVKNDYKWESSVTTMLEQLKWQSLEQRRTDSRLTLMFKI